MKAVISYLGKQYLVSEGDEIIVNKVNSDPDKKIEIANVLLISDKESVILDNSRLKEAKVEAELLKTNQGKKIKVLKFKAKKRYQRVFGHRQEYSKIKITKIKG